MWKHTLLRLLVQYMCAYVHIYIYVCMYICMYVCVYIYMYVLHTWRLREPEGGRQGFWIQRFVGFRMDSVERIRAQS